MNITFFLQNFGHIYTKSHPNKKPHAEKLHTDKFYNTIAIKSTQINNS